MSEREGNVGERGVSVSWVGVFFGCRGGMIWAGRCDFEIIRNNYMMKTLYFISNLLQNNKTHTHTFIIMWVCFKLMFLAIFLHTLGKSEVSLRLTQLLSTICCQ